MIPMEITRKTRVLLRKYLFSLHRHPVRSFCEKSSKETASREEWPRRVVTGVQPTGALHIGNYFGAVRRCVRLLDQGEDLTVFIADLHSLTVRQDASVLQRNTLELAAYLIASGLEPARCVVFQQSAVPRHAELCWALACVATLARLSHLPQYKEKAKLYKEVPVGLLLYPVLQAADVLVYGGTHVPVGRDQLQHLQLAAQLVRSFNHRYGAALPAPQPLLPDDGSDRILSLRDPTKKMSKSDTDPKSRILLSDPDDVIELKIRKAVTDFTPHVTYEPESRPGVSNLVRLHCLAADILPEEAVEEADGLNTAQYKALVARALVRHLAPIRERARRLLADPRLIHAALQHGAARARARADTTHERLARLMGTAPLYTALARDGDGAAGGEPAPAPRTRRPADCATATPEDRPTRVAN
ncbi:hypothetical protein evm_003918 [Chilo suppressalis]|nr:hypothetical protein evm_003918 [Chilo suppressalis]